MKYKIREENHVMVIHAISNIAKLSSYAPIPELVRRDMTREMAEFLSREKITTREQEFVTEYRMELFVFSPNEFYQAVQEEAQELMRFFNRPNPGVIK